MFSQSQGDVRALARCRSSALGIRRLLYVEFLAPSFTFALVTVSSFLIGSRATYQCQREMIEKSRAWLSMTENVIIKQFLVIAATTKDQLASHHHLAKSSSFQNWVFSCRTHKQVTISRDPQNE